MFQCQIDDPPRIYGHRSAVLDISFNPFVPQQLVTASDDGHIKVWRIPDEGLTESMQPDQALADFDDHGRSVKTVNFHNVAANLLFSSGLDMTLRVWDLEAQRCATVIEGFEDFVLNVSFNYTGTSVVTAAKDKKIRIIDVRTASIVHECDGHPGVRGQRVLYTRNDNRLFSVGFGRGSERQYSLWDVRSLGRALSTTTLDYSSGMLMPLYDEDTGVVYLSGKGDSSIKLVDVDVENDTIHTCNEYLAHGGQPLCGITLLPKSICDVRNVEIGQVLRLTQAAVEPISFKVPRARDEFFQDDIFVPTRDYSLGASITAEDWLNGQDGSVVTTSLRPQDMVPLSEKPQEKPKVQKSAQFREQLLAEQELEKKRNAAFNRMQMLAEQYESANPNLSMGTTQKDDDDWSD